MFVLCKSPKINASSTALPEQHEHADVKEQIGDHVSHREERRPTAVSTARGAESPESVCEQYE
jgi:hypothetical protein